MNITKEKVAKLLDFVEAYAGVSPEHECAIILRGLEDTNNVKIPTSIEEATAMHLVATAWLKQNRGLEDAAPVCNHEWFQTGAMLSNEKRCIKCGEWGKLYTSPQVAQTEAALCEMVRLSEDAGLYDSDFQAGRAGSKP